MNNQDIDVNLIIQSFQEKITQLITENIVKDATIKQLVLQMEQPASTDQTDKEDK